MSTSKRKVQLTTVGFDNSANRAPTPQRPVRSRARSLAMDAHIAPHQHPWSQFTFCASGLMQVTVTQEERQTTYIVPSTRAVWIPPQVQHHVVVLETAELRTVDLDPCVTPKDWTDCKVLVVSKLLRELVHALEDSVPGARDDAIMALSADEMARATTQALGVPMPHPEHGDKRLRALCEAVLRNPADKTHLRDWVTYRRQRTHGGAIVSGRTGYQFPTMAPTSHLGTRPAPARARHADQPGCCRQRLRKRQCLFCHVQVGYGQSSANFFE